jgi:catechol 2,3-dioxygenase-like lactoylglutathione lyase family enzyme
VPRTFDHAVICVSDLDRASATYRSLGFTLTPQGVHPFGTRNVLAQFAGRNFLELLAIGDLDAIVPHELPERFSFSAHNQDFLRQNGEGMSMLVFAGQDARADVEAFRAAGLDTFEPFDFGRTAKLPDGTLAQVAFSLAFVTNPQMPGMAFFTCQQRHAPELFWKPQYQRHANRAERLVEIVISAPEPMMFRDFFGRLTGSQVIADADGARLSVGTQSDRISILTPQRLRRRFPEVESDALSASMRTPRFVALRIVVADLGTTRRLLEEGNVPHRFAEGSIVVRPGAAHGVALEFVHEPAPTGSP